MTGIIATALRIRNHETSCTAQFHDIYVHDNTFIANTDIGKTAEAMAVRVSLKNNSMNDAGIVFEDNTVKAITYDPSRTVQAFVLDGIAAGINPVIKGNTIESNCTSIQIGGSDGSSISDALFISNTIQKSADGATVTIERCT